MLSDKGIGKVARKLGVTRKQVRDAIERIKDPFRGKGKTKKNGPKNNPDMDIDDDFNVRPKAPDGTCGDPWGNLRDMLVEMGIL